LIGILGGLAFYLKQNTVGLWVVYGALLVFSRVTTKQAAKLVKDLLALAAGILILSGVWAAYFALQGALNDFWNQAFLYNFVYIRKREAFSQLIPLFIKGFAYLNPSGLLYFSLAGGLVALAYVWKNRRDILGGFMPLVLLALIDFPMEVFMIAISGRSILHYYLTPLPVMAILSGVLGYAAWQTIRRAVGLVAKQALLAADLILLLLVLLSQVPQVGRYQGYMDKMAQDDYAPVVAYITAHSSPQDYVLLIGAESVVNFLSRRVAPTRYVYQYPLALTGSRVMVEEFFHQIQANQPALIVDTRGRSSLDDHLYTAFYKRSDYIPQAVQTLAREYRPVADFGEWIVYAYAGN
jgi:hypothetical protein